MKLLVGAEELGYETIGIPQALSFRCKVRTEIPKVFAACVRLPWCWIRDCSTAARSKSSSEVLGGISMCDLRESVVASLFLPESVFEIVCIHKVHRG